MSSLNPLADRPHVAETTNSKPLASKLLGAPIIIACISGILALATASERSSVTHLGSLIYGVVLWGWWGCIAGLLWKLAPRYPSLVRFSPAGIAAHLVTASALGVLHLLFLWSLVSPLDGTTA